MICPKCGDPKKGSQFDIYNSIMKDGTYCCPNCDVQLTNEDVEEISQETDFALVPWQYP